MDDQLPIISHESLGADCCGCLMVRVREHYADIICNECDAVIRTIPVAEVESALREMARTDAVCSARCSYCRAVTTFPGWRTVEAFNAQNVAEAPWPMANYSDRMRRFSYDEMDRLTPCGVCGSRRYWFDEVWRCWHCEPPPSEGIICVDLKETVN